MADNLLKKSTTLETAVEDDRSLAWRVWKKAYELDKRLHKRDVTISKNLKAAAYCSLRRALRSRDKIIVNFEKAIKHLYDELFWVIHDSDDEKIDYNKGIQNPDVVVENKMELELDEADDDLVLDEAGERAKDDNEVNPNEDSGPSHPVVKDVPILKLDDDDAYKATEEEASSDEEADMVKDDKKTKLNSNNGHSGPEEMGKNFKATNKKNKLRKKPRRRLTEAEALRRTHMTPSEREKEEWEWTHAAVYTRKRSNNSSGATV